MGGFILQLGGVTIAAQCAAQTATSLSVCGAELQEASRGAAALEAHAEFITELGLAGDNHAVLYCDNKGVEQIANSQTSFGKRSLALARRARYLLTTCRS